jgi:hypothetical protein
LVRYPESAEGPLLFEADSIFTLRSGISPAIKPGCNDPELAFLRLDHTSEIVNLISEKAMSPNGRYTASLTATCLKA